MTSVKSDNPPAAAASGPLDTHQKALAVNLDPTCFGSFAEIGAGQEVARWFLRVGGASGTVAKTISAYDKEVSDDLYGSGTRYVSKQRLEAMLAQEWESLHKQVGDARGATTRLFAFADTIAARNYAGTNDCHGWLGFRFQDRPQGDFNDIVLHVNLRDSANVLQQEAVGTLGVNLLHALLCLRSPAADLPAQLLEGLSSDRIEIDQIEARGRALACDMPRLHAGLARDGHAEAVTLAADGVALAANEFLYKKSVVIVPVARDPADGLSSAAVEACVEELRRDVAGNADVKDVIALRLVTLDSNEPPRGVSDPRCGGTMYTRHQPLYRATAFIRRYTQAPLRFAITLPMLMRIFDNARYEHLEGRLLEGIAKLFGHDVRVLASPARREDVRRLLGIQVSGAWKIDDGDSWIAADQVQPAPPLDHLYQYLLSSGFIVAMRSSETKRASDAGS